MRAAPFALALRAWPRGVFVPATWRGAAFPLALALSFALAADAGFRRAAA